MPELDFKTVAVFVGLTVLLGGGAAFASGRALAQTWRPVLLLPAYMLLLAAAVRFCHFALFDEPLFDLPRFLADVAVEVLIAAAGYRLTRVRQMQAQYPWIYREGGLLRWSDR